MELLQAEQFFATARERYRIKLKRDAGEPYPWSSDPIFNEWRFTNVHREHDRTTIWLREHIREPLTAKQAPKLKIVESTIIFRWFNRVTTAEHILDLLLGQWDTEEARRRLRDVKPLVTGAYMIKSRDGMKKLDGILETFDEAREQLAPLVPTWGNSLEGAWSDIKECSYLGPFLAHEIVQDLRWTPVLSNATDINTWTNCGPGATKGMSQVIFGEPRRFNRGSREDQETMRQGMLQLLEMSWDGAHWPADWPEWELHEVEMWLCEYFKIVRIQNGGVGKRRYP